MYEKINYTLVGIFVVVTTALLVLFAFWLAKEDISNNKFNRYYCYFNESVDGLNVDSTIKLNGVNVGRLKELKIDSNEPSKIKATLNIVTSIIITKDMFATLKSQGLTGLRYINIVGGKSKDIIKPNKVTSIIKTKQSLVSKLSSTTPMLLEKISAFTNRLDRVLSDKNLNNIESILQNSKNITNETIKLEKSFNALLIDINSTKLQDITKIAKDLNKSISLTLLEYKKLAKNGNLALNKINKKLPKLLINLDRSSLELIKTTKLIRRTINRGDYNLKRVLQPAVIDLKGLAISYKELSDELKSIAQDPANSLFNGKSVPRGPGE